MTEPDHPRLSIVRQRELASINGSSFYREPTMKSEETLRLMMTEMGLAPIYQHPKTSEPHPRHKVYPYLLRHLTVDLPDHVWCADVTHIPFRRGFLYLVAIMDWPAARY